MAGTSTQCNKIILLLIIVILMYLLLCKNSSGFGGSIARLVGGSNVKKLTSSNYKDTVGKNNIVFIKVFTTWCGYCNKMSGAWEELGKMSSNDNDVIIAEVDADKEKELAQTLGAKGFPTIVLVKNGAVKEVYNGNRDAASMKAFIDKNK